jgi:hypothetical protein
LKRYAALKSSPRPGLVSPLAKLSDDGAFAAAVFCPGPDFRRVVRELWPQLPGPLAPLTGDLADKWLHLELAINLPPDWKPRVTLQAIDAAGVDTFVKLLQAVPDAIEQFGDLGEQRHVVKQQAQTILDVLPPRQEGARVTLMLPTDDEQLAKLKPLLGNVTNAAMASAHRDKRFNQFKQLAIAAINHHEARKFFPPQAIRSQDGKPLLSWRVALLPFLEDGGLDLYNQFHLDEPWDSPHNRTLIAKMPATFADPDQNLAQLAKDGKTTYVVPMAKGTIFAGDKDVKFADIADGTSKTIMFVEVDPLHAVVWTKPEDWDVDLENPLRGVNRDDRKQFVAAFADAHVEAIPVNVDPGKLRGLLTRDGREVFDWP